MSYEGKWENSYIQGGATQGVKGQVGKEEPAGAEPQGKERIGEEDKTKAG